MPKVLHVSFLWDDDTTNKRHSDYILAMGWVKEGWDVLYFDYRANAEEYGNDKMNESLVRIVNEHQPDLLWFTKSVGASKRFGRKTVSCQIRGETLRKIRESGFKGKIIHWFLDQRYDHYQSTIDIGSESDWFFYVSAGDRLVEYSKKMDTPTSFIIVPFEPTFTSPQPFEQRDLDLIWMGGDHKPSKNQFEQTRYELLKKMITTGELNHYYGCFKQRKVWCPEYHKILGRSKMVLSLYAFDRPMYFSNRLAHAIGAKAAILSYDFKDRDKIFSDNDGIFFKTFTEFKKKKKYYLNNIDELEWVANNGHNVAREYFDSRKVVREILHTLRNGKSSYPFGQTYNPKGIKFDIPESEKETGSISYLDIYGRVLEIDEYSAQFDPQKLKELNVRRRNAARAESLKALHAQKRSMTVDLPRQSGQRLLRGKKPRIQ